MSDFEKEDFDTYAALLERLIGELSRLPGPLRRKMEKEINQLLELVRDRRAPRFMLVGRRGAGKSTLINAILGQRVQKVGPVAAQTAASTWLRYEADGRAIEILDTRGVQEGSKPAEEDGGATTAEKSILRSIEEARPDAVLFLCKAKEVDAAIGGDLDAVERILRKANAGHDFRLPIVGVLTQTDELDPPFIRELPTDDAEKNENIEHATELLQEHIEARPYLRESLARVIPTVGYVRFRQDGSMDTERDYRWNIDVLVDVLLNEIPREVQLDFARLARVKRFQKKVAQRVVDVCALACGGIGFQPLPLADFPILTSIQSMMVLAIAYVSGRELSVDAAKEFIGACGVNAGAGFAVREGVRALVKLVPGWGNAVSGAVAALATEALGHAAIAFYIDEKEITEVKKELKKKRKKK